MTVTSEQELLANPSTGEDPSARVAHTHTLCGVCSRYTFSDGRKAQEIEGRSTRAPARTAAASRMANSSAEYLLSRAGFLLLILDEFRPGKPKKEKKKTVPVPLDFLPNFPTTTPLNASPLHERGTRPGGRTKIVLLSASRRRRDGGKFCV
jgi:hypothetical protein